MPGPSKSVTRNDEAVEISLPVPGRDLLTDKEHDAMLTVEPLGVAVLREEQRA